MLIRKNISENPVLAWRLLGSAAWAFLVFITCSAIVLLPLHPLLLFHPYRLISNIFSLTSIIWLAAFVLANIPTFLTASAVITSQEPRIRIVIPRVLWSFAAPINGLIGKTSARIYSLSTCVSWLTHIVLHSISALLALMVFVTLDSTGGKVAFSVLVKYSTFLGMIHTLVTIYFSLDVLYFPAIQRHRYFRAKQAVPWVMKHAFFIVLSSFLVCVLTGERFQVATWIPLFKAGMQCALCWQASAAALQIVMTERLKPDDYSSRDSMKGMTACLQGARGGLMKSLALHDLVYVSSTRGRGAWRRGDIFLDESGDTWTPIATACIAEVNAIISIISPPPSAKEEAQKKTTKWNALPPIISASAVSATKQQLLLLSRMRLVYQDFRMAVLALSSLALASLQEDQFGVLQLTKPGLNEIALALLNTLKATRQVAESIAALPVQSMASLGPWHHGNGDRTPEGIPLALKDVLLTELHSLSEAFGPNLLSTSATPADALILLQQILKGEL